MTRQQRLVVSIMITFAVGLIVVGYTLTDTGDSTTLSPAFEELIPAAGSEILAQDRVGIDLASGYDARLTVNGIPIPDDQLTRVAALNEVTFSPGSDREFESWPGGNVCVEATYWLIAAGDDDASTFVWCFETV